VLEALPKRQDPWTLKNLFGSPQKGSEAYLPLKLHWELQPFLQGEQRIDRWAGDLKWAYAKTW